VQGCKKVEKIHENFASEGQKHNNHGQVC